MNSLRSRNSIQMPKRSLRFHRLRGDRERRCRCHICRSDRGYCAEATAQALFDEMFGLDPLFHHGITIRSGFVPEVGHEVLVGGRIGIRDLTRGRSEFVCVMWSHRSSRDRGTVRRSHARGGLRPGIAVTRRDRLGWSISCFNGTTRTEMGNLIVTNWAT